MVNTVFSTDCTTPNIASAHLGLQHCKRPPVAGSDMVGHYDEGIPVSSICGRRTWGMWFEQLKHQIPLHK